MACMPATTPYCMKASMRRASLGVMIRREIEVADLAAEMRGESCRVEAGDRTDAAAAGDDRAPGGCDIVTDRGHDPETRNHDASFAQRRLLNGTLNGRRRCAIASKALPRQARSI